MDGRNGRQFGLPSGPASGFRPPPPRPPIAPQTPSQQSMFNSPISPPPQTTTNPVLMSKADQYADDKRRIIESCFAKREGDGMLSEEYICHIRVVEDARYPTHPPPPTSGAENKKPRVIILSVRNTGRVRMHKARENSNGSFSVGKTWNFEDLTTIESFTNRQPRTEQDAQYVAWAGDTGFTVMIQKQYFWNTNSTREKSFFIGSLAKVFKRYSGGKIPDLIGFTAAELDQIYAHVDRNSTAPPPGLPRGSQPPIPMRGGAVQRPQDSPDMMYQDSSPSPQIPPLLSSRRAFSPQDSAGSMSPPAPDSLRTGVLRQPPSREQLMPPNNNQSPYGRGTPQSSLSEGQNRDTTPDSVKLNSRRGGGFYQAPAVASSSNESGSGNGLGITNRGTNGDLNSRGPNNYSNESLPQAAAPAPAPLPERRRPPLVGGVSSQSRYSPNEQISAMPKPLVPRNPEKAVTPEPAPLEIPKKATDRYVIGSSTPTPPAEPPKAEPEPKPLPQQLSESPERLETPKDEDSAETTSIETKEENDDVVKPGLGRMFGKQKKSTRDLFKQAATTYTAFKPRAGGAAAKLFATETKSNEADGITGVFTAPSRTKTNDSAKSFESSQDSNSIQATPTSALAAKQSLPDMKVTTPGATEKAVEQLPLRKDGVSAVKSLSDLQQAAADAQAKSKAAEEEASRRKLRRTPQQVKYLECLGIDPSLIEGRGLEYEALLEEFWPESCWHTKSVDTLQAEVRRELSRAQTGSWFEHLALQDSGRQAAIKLVDVAMEESEVLEKLLTIYSVELSSLSDDIAYIEAQSQGLSVQSSNQKVLMKELQDLLGTINVPQHQLEPIYQGTFVSLDGLENTERAVLALYQALVKIDPQIKLHNSGTPDQNTEAIQLSRMRALQQKRNVYMDAGFAFIGRFKNYMDIVVGKAILRMQSEAQRRSGPNGTHLTLDDINAGRSELWMFSPLLLFAKSLDKTSWTKLVQSYSSKMQAIYGDTVKSAIQKNIKSSRGSPGEEQELLFTFNEQQPDMLGIGGRKLTVRRNQAFSRTFRAASGEKAGGQAVGGVLMPYEAVHESLNEITPLLLSEQNFIADFFHANSTETADFAEAAQSSLPENRRAPFDLQRKPYEPDPFMSQFIKDVMADMFSFLPIEIRDLVNWSLNIGPLQGVGVLYALHQKMEKIDDGFLFQELHAIASKLESDWDKFVQMQIRAIEDTKVKIKKRKGVIHFMKVFPSFAGHLEGMVPPANENNGRVRELLDKGYKDIIKAMFDSLRTIAKESPTASTHAAGDPEDKEALNYHILLIENMNHYVEYVDDRGSKPLADGKTKALDEFEDHLALYVNAVIRRPLGKIMDFTESLSQALDSSTATSNSFALASKPAFSPQAYKKLVSAHDARELRKGVEALRRRVEKHFGDFVDKDEQEISHNLIAKVLGKCEERFSIEIEKMQTIPRQVYGQMMDEGTVSSAGLAVSREDVSKWFKGLR